MIIINAVILSTLAVHGHLTAAQEATNQMPPSVILIESKGPLFVNSSVSSDVINETNIRSGADCAFRCLTRGCAAAVVMETSRTCQLVIIHNASHLQWPLGGHVTRLLGNESGAKVLKVANFEDVIRASIIRLRFDGSGTGRQGLIQQALINVSGCYLIEAAGARGGNHEFSTIFKKFGGKGALVSGRFNLTSGTRLSIVVGLMGGGVLTSARNGAGGGGGSFVYITGHNQLLVAAGGGGGGSINYNGGRGLAGTNGSKSFTLSISEFSDAVIGGVFGQPGFNLPNNSHAVYKHGGCGAGWLGKAVNPRRGSGDGDGGGGLADGWVGGLAGDGGSGYGGFGGGGGGGGNSTNDGASGGGGGFSGGGAGLSSDEAGGAGGSQCLGRDCTAATGGNANGDNGFVSMLLLAPFASTC